MFLKYKGYSTSCLVTWVEQRDIPGENGLLQNKCENQTV